MIPIFTFCPVPNAIAREPTPPNRLRNTATYAQLGYPVAACTTKKDAGKETSTPPEELSAPDRDLAASAPALSICRQRCADVLGAKCSLSGTNLLDYSKGCRTNQETTGALGNVLPLRSSGNRFRSGIRTSHRMPEVQEGNGEPKRRSNPLPHERKRR